MPEFTPTEERMLKVLSDGERHLKQELFECLGDDLQLGMNVSVHLFYLRKKLAKVGQLIVCESYYRRFYYRLTRHIASAVDGRK